MSNLDMTKFDDAVILITGGAGFVGSNLVRYLVENSSPKAILVIDNYLSSDPEKLPDDPRLRILVGSAGDPKVLDRLPKHIDYVFHLSCYHGNQSSIHDPLADHDNNSYPSLVLFDRISKNNGIKKVVYAAAGCAVAEKTFDAPAATSEDAPVSLFHDSPYSISKLIGEMYGNYYFSHDGMPFVKARFQNVYGPGEVLGAGQWRGTEHTIWRNVIPTFVWKALNGEEIPLENGGQGSRDFIFVDDLTEGLCRAALVGSPGESYNLASGVETTIELLARTVIAESSSSSELLYLEDSRPWDNSGRRYGSVEKSLRELQFSARTGLTDGVRMTVQWSRANEARIRRSVEKYD